MILRDIAQRLRRPSSLEGSSSRNNDQRSIPSQANPFYVSIVTDISFSCPLFLLVMSSSRTRRIAKEVADIHADTTSHILASPIGNGDDLTHLKGSFQGPPGTPYEGGNYIIDVKIPNDYPFRPPIMKFDTKVWHPNVSSQTVSR